VIKTLHGYLARDLAKVTALALAAFTLLMTIFAIMEPLRKEGLGASQALLLAAYTVPIMLSLTLPVAALFAAAIVYGRFSQDNELMACRASGISTLTLLKPALALGGVVTIISMLLSGLVTPRMAELVETSVKANVRTIAYRQLRTRPYADYGQYVIHADAVDEDQDVIYGLVVAKTKPRDDVALVVAPRALVKFTEQDGATFVTFYLQDVALARTSEYTIVEAASHPPITQEIPSLAKEEPSWYTWNELLAMLENPLRNSRIRRYLREEVVQKLCGDLLMRRIAAAIRRDEPYAGLRDAQYAYEIRAGEIRPLSDGAVTLGGAPNQPVEITIYRAGEDTPYQQVSAGEARVVTARSELSRDWYVTLEALEDVTVLPLTESRVVPQRRTSWTVGQLPLPGDVVAEARAIPLMEILRDPSSVTDDAKIIDDIDRLKHRSIRRLISRIKAEMHMRAAYSLSCLLMVALGAALGLIFRGGQVVSAFAITVVPASLVIVMMLMGKQMVTNPDVSAYWGLVTIWAGILLLAAGDVGVYLYLRCL